MPRGKPKSTASITNKKRKLAPLSKEANVEESNAEPRASHGSLKKQPPSSSPSPPRKRKRGTLSSNGDVNTESTGETLTNKKSAGTTKDLGKPEQAQPRAKGGGKQNAKSSAAPPPPKEKAVKGKPKAVPKAPKKAAASSGGSGRRYEKVEILLKPRAIRNKIRWNCICGIFWIIAQKESTAANEPEQGDERVQTWFEWALQNERIIMDMAGQSLPTYRRKMQSFYFILDRHYHDLRRQQTYDMGALSSFDPVTIQSLVQTAPGGANSFSLGAQQGAKQMDVEESMTQSSLVPACQKKRPEQLQQIIAEIEKDLYVKDLIGDSGAMIRCKCGSDDIVRDSQQTRSGDEGMTHFFLCKKCKRRWKD